MKTAVMLTTFVCFLGLSGPAQAGPTLSSPAIFGSLNQDKAFCTLRHIGTSGTISVEVDIFTEQGNVVPPSSDFCTTPLTAGKACFIEAVIPSGAAHACSAKVLSGNAKNLRGTLTVVDDLGLDLDLLRSAELR